MLELINVRLSALNVRRMLLYARFQRFQTVPIAKKHSVGANARINRFCFLSISIKLSDFTIYCHFFSLRCAFPNVDCEIWRHIIVRGAMSRESGAAGRIACTFMQTTTPCLKGIILPCVRHLCTVRYCVKFIRIFIDHSTNILAAVITAAGPCKNLMTMLWHLIDRQRMRCFAAGAASRIRISCSQQKSIFHALPCSKAKQVCRISGVYRHINSAYRIHLAQHFLGCAQNAFRCGFCRIAVNGIRKIRLNAADIGNVAVRVIIRFFHITGCPRICPHNLFSGSIVCCSALRKSLRRNCIARQIKQHISTIDDLVHRCHFLNHLVSNINR
nr:MAG TPA: hypothetical protein [Caudoviricetes sp.]